jgi:uncharacterized protein involved in outer membrane biogenesis
MGKLIKLIFIGIPVLIIAVIVVLVFSVNSIIKHGVETVGPMALGTDVTLQKVDISLFSGKGQLKGIIIGNPEGFKTDNSFKLNEVRLALDVSSLFSERIIIDEIFIDAPEITYEKSGKGDNFKAIMDNVNDFAGAAEGKASEDKKDESKEDGKKIQINNLIVKDGKVNMSMTALKGEQLTLPLTDIHLKDIGKDEGGTSIADAVKVVFGAVNKNVIGAVAGSAKAIAETAEKAAGETVGKAKETVGGAVDKLKGLFGK